MSCEKLAHQLIELYDRFTAWEHSVARKTDLSPTQLHVIETLGHAPGLRMTELARRLSITTGTLTPAIDRLERQDFVSRVRSTEDRRSWHVFLTEQGTNLFEQHHQDHIDFTNTVFGELKEQERAHFSTILARVLKDMDRR